MKNFLTFTFALGLGLSLGACGGSGGDTRGTTDMAGPHTTPSGDLAMTVTGSTDMATSSGGTAGCKATITCENACITTGGTQQAEQSCITACDAMESSNGTTLENALKSCVVMACPEQSQDAGVTTTNSPCAYDPSTGAPISDSACSMCQMTAQSSGGTCYAANMACNADM